MQLKACFKKEWAQFARTFRVWGVIIVILGLTLSNPIMFKFVSVVMNELTEETPSVSTASLINTVDQAPSEGSEGGLLGGIDMEEALAMYSDAGMMFSVTLSTFTSAGLLVIMLILMSAAGGEQKKRAMIVPMCSGLEYKNYLLPKFIIYPLFTFAATFLGSLTAGGLCNSMFENNKISASGMFLSALDTSVYMLFIVSVFLSLGLCTSRPGVLVPCVFLGQTMIEGLFNSIGLVRFHPFALLTYISSGVITSAEYSFDGEIPSFITALALSLVLSVLMYFLALGVLKAKKIDNQAEKEPEF